MWSEEELRDIPPDPPRLRSTANPLRQEIATLNRTRNQHHPHELTRNASTIYGPAGDTHGNFIAASYRRIQANPLWAARLTKPHTSKRQARIQGPDEMIRAWNELDACTSSDALLMNIFCYPRVFTPRLCALLGVEQADRPTFSYRPMIERERNLIDRTEIDMRLGCLLVEAKLTESDFQIAPMRLLERYPAFNEVFDRDLLPITSRGVESYQLIRGVLAAHHERAAFCVVSDARRPDLAEAWYGVIRAVRSFQMQSRLRLLTWQELAAVVPSALQSFLEEKYGISVGRF